MPAPAIASIGVVVGLDLVGDALIKLPFLRALRACWPGARIAWITAQGPTAYGGVLRGATAHLLDEVHETPPWLWVAGRERPVGGGPAFDLLIDTRGRWREARCCRASVPHRVFVSPAARFLFSDRRPGVFEARPPHLVDRLLRLVRLAGGEVPARTTGRLPVPAEVVARARALLPEGPAYTGFAPGAGNRAKVWPLDRFVAVAQAQPAPVFLLGPQELEWLGALREAVPGALFPLQEDWGAASGLEPVLAVAGLLRLAVANDSGTGHMLAAADCPLVSLFGPTSAAKLAPRVSHGVVVTAQEHGGAAMTAIPAARVLGAISDLQARLG